MRLRVPALWPAKGLRAALVLNLSLGLVALVGIGWSYVLISGSAAASDATPAAGGSRPVTVSQGDVVSTATATGSVASASTAAADFVTGGTVTAILVEVGDTVAKDQALANVDPVDAQAELNTANANLTAAKASRSRAEAAAGDEATADDAAIAAAQAQVTTAQAAVDAATRALAGTTLRAPMAGTVTAVNGNVGATTSGAGSNSGGSSGGGSNSGSSSGAGSSSGGSSNGAAGSGQSDGFIELVDVSHLQVTANFAEADATKLKVGQIGTVSWAALANTTAPATVATISPTATTANNVNSYGVVMSLDQLPAGVRIGQTVTLTVTIAEAKNVVRVPAAAIRTTGARRLVTVVGAGGNETRAIQVGVEGDSFTEVTSGLAVGDRVLIVVATSGTGTNGSGFPGAGLGGGFGGGGAGAGGGGFGGGGTRAGNGLGGGARR